MIVDPITGMPGPLHDLTGHDDPCLHCGASQSDRPMVFRGEAWCSDLCRKALTERVTVRR